MCIWLVCLFGLFAVVHAHLGLLPYLADIYDLDSPLALVRRIPGTFLYLCAQAALLVAGLGFVVLHTWFRLRHRLTNLPNGDGGQAVRARGGAPSGPA